MSAPLVVGVDVGSQGTCAQALEPDGTAVATSYAEHALSYPRAAWAEQDPAQWTAALAARGLTVHHGVAELRPWNADGEVARRLDVPRGTLLLTVEQVDRMADGTPVLFSCEHHLADAFAFTVLRRGPGEHGEEAP